MDNTHVTVLNLKREKLSSFSLPSDNGGWGLKVDSTLIYLTLLYKHQIFVYSLSGALIKTFATEKSGRGEGQFNAPYGVTVDERDLYICDTNNHRVQVLQKDTGTYQRQWGSKGTEEGQFTYPSVIYLVSDRKGKGGEIGSRIVYV